MILYLYLEITFTQEKCLSVIHLANTVGKKCGCYLDEKSFFFSVCRSLTRAPKTTSGPQQDLMSREQKRAPTCSEAHTHRVCTSRVLRKSPEGMRMPQQEVEIEREGSGTFVLLPKMLRTLLMSRYGDMLSIHSWQATDRVTQECQLSLASAFYMGCTLLNTKRIRCTRVSPSMPLTFTVREWVQNWIYPKVPHCLAFNSPIPLLHYPPYPSSSASLSSYLFLLQYHWSINV